MPKPRQKAIKKSLTVDVSFNVIANTSPITIKTIEIFFKWLAKILSINASVKSTL